MSDDALPSLDQYRRLAEFRYRIRRFLHASESICHEHQVEPQQHQLLLALHGLPEGVKPTIKSLAERLYLRHHTTVELANRLTQLGALQRTPSPDDGREVLLRVTAKGTNLLEKLSAAHWNELQNSGPDLKNALRALLPSKETKLRG